MFANIVVSCHSRQRVTEESQSPPLICGLLAVRYVFSAALFNTLDFQCRRRYVDNAEKIGPCWTKLKKSRHCDVHAQTWRRELNQNDWVT